MIYSVYLKQVQFFAYHGLYPEEAIHGNTFEVNLTIRYVREHKTHSIQDTIDYAAAYEILQRQMLIRRELLEALIESIMDELISVYPQIAEIELDICKTNPPIEGMKGAAGISVKKIFR